MAFVTIVPGSTPFHKRSQVIKAASIVARRQGSLFMCNAKSRRMNHAAYPALL
jgi:hypothetical protein